MKKKNIKKSFNLRKGSSMSELHVSKNLTICILANVF